MKSILKDQRVALEKKKFELEARDAIRQKAHDDIFRKRKSETELARRKKEEKLASARLNQIKALEDQK